MQERFLIVNRTVEDFISELYANRRKPYFYELEAIAQRSDFPIVGPQVGSILYLISLIKKPSIVFEIGSGFGYSALWFLSAGARVYLTDYDEKNMSIAKRYISKAGFEKNAVFLIGDGIKYLREFNGNPDIVFIDCEKSRYYEAFEAAKSKLAPRGILIADNALWGGRVIYAEDQSSRGIKKFLDSLFLDKDFESVLLPVRDGVVIAYKI